MDMPNVGAPNPWPDTHRQPLFAALVAAVLVGLVGVEIVGIAVKARTLATIGAAPPQPRTIMVSGMGRVRANPDVAVVTAGFTAMGADVRVVQGEVNQKTTALIAAVKGAGIPSVDIQTEEFSVNPQYAYGPEKGPQLTGYEARQTVRIQIRALTRIGAVLDVVGSSGATNIGGLQFTFDDPAQLRSDARAKAVAAARSQASAIAGALGVRLGKPMAFNESQGGGMMAMSRFALEGMGGGGLGASAPSVEPGSNEIVSQVSVTYELQ